MILWIADAISPQIDPRFIDGRPLPQIVTRSFQSLLRTIFCDFVLISGHTTCPIKYKSNGSPSQSRETTKILKGWKDANYVLLYPHRQSEFLCSRIGFWQSLSVSSANSKPHNPMCKAYFERISCLRNCADSSPSRELQVNAPWIWADQNDSIGPTTSRIS
jgi:hypothetical protein